MPFQEITGVIRVSRGRVSFDINPGLADYYRWLIYKEFPNLIGGLGTSRHNLHITLANPKLHTINQTEADLWHGVTGAARFNPEHIHLGGFKKNFIGFYVKVSSFFLEMVRYRVVIGGNLSSLHLTLLTSKGHNI